MGRQRGQPRIGWHLKAHALPFPRNFVRYGDQSLTFLRLTYMTIRSVINLWIASGDLWHVSPSLPFTPCVRHVFVSEEVRVALQGPWASRELERRFARATAFLDGFTEGLSMSVRFPPSKAVAAQVALLENANEEVWELRIRDPKPGIRLFGRFSERNHFIALTWASRKDLETDDDWIREKERCKREWRRLFPSFPPHTGIEPNDYLSDSFSV